MKIESLALSEKEKALVERYAQQHELTLDEAATKLFAEGLAARVRRHTGVSPAKNVQSMQGRGRA